MKKILFAAAVLIALTACSSDDQTAEQRMPVTLAYTNLDATEVTRAAQNLNQTFATGEGIKVRISNTGADQWTDYTFTTAANGALTAPNPAPYYPAGSQNIDIAAYYPATAGTSFTVATDQRADADYKRSDLMFASVTNQAKQAEAVNLHFSHKMAKLCLNITAGEGVSSITNVSILNVQPTVSFDQATGAVGTASGDATTIAVSNQGAAVIPAQTITGGLLSIETDKGTATYSVPAGKTFEAGHYYTMNITVNLRAVGANTDITDWISEGSLTVNPVEALYEPVGVELRQTELVMRVGTQEFLAWNPIPTYASKKNVSWMIDGEWTDYLSPDNDLVAWVSPEGLVTAKKAGTAKIYVMIENNVNGKTYQYWSEKCIVTVVDNFDSYAVDLGLPSGLKWASCNIGTNKPEGFGNYYAWGETRAKNSYAWCNYKYYIDPDPDDKLYDTEDSWSDTEFIAGVSRYEYVVDDDVPVGETVLSAEDDAATAQWGDGWRMPTKADFKELLDNTDHRWTVENGMGGWKFTSKEEGNNNSIFLPAAGYRQYDVFYYYYNSGNVPEGHYWTSEVYENLPLKAWMLYFDSDEGYNTDPETHCELSLGTDPDYPYVAIDGSRCTGKPIRAVYVPSASAPRRMTARRRK